MNNSLDIHNFFKPFKKTLIAEFGREEASRAVLKLVSVLPEPVVCQI